MTSNSRRTGNWPVNCLAAIAAVPLLVGALAPAGAGAATRGSAKASGVKASARIPAPLPPPPPAQAEAIRDAAGGKFEDFYAQRAYRPLWLVKGRAGPAAQDLLRWIESAELDGLKPSRYGPDKLRQALADARGGDPQVQADTDVLFSRAFVRYVGDMRKLRKTGMEFAGDGLKPPRLSGVSILRVASSRDFDGYIDAMAWMSPHYLRMRGALANALDARAPAETIRRLRTNLERARALPSPYVAHIVVDAVSARLWYYENGRQVGTMKVVVGAQKTQTPMLAGWINWAIINPYWNIPDYLTRDNVARKILSGRTLDSMHMQVLSDWSANPRVVDPGTVNWQAVAAGKQDVRIRELPGPWNSMGQMKFVFPNSHGIYLHDTPNRDLLDKDDRHLSNGCIRLEDAPGLGRWLMGRAVVTKGKAPETPEALRAPVPVYLTYLTATGTKTGFALLDDVYGRDL